MIVELPLYSHDMKCIQRALTAPSFVDRPDVRGDIDARSTAASTAHSQIVFPTPTFISTIVHKHSTRRSAHGAPCEREGRRDDLRTRGHVCTPSTARFRGLLDDIPVSVLRLLISIPSPSALAAQLSPGRTFVRTSVRPRLPDRIHVLQAQGAHCCSSTI